MSHTALSRLKDKLHRHPIESINADQTSGREILDTYLSDDIAHYVISDEILELIDDEEFHKTLAAMAKAGIRDLPFDPLLIEFRNHPKSNDIHFIRLQSTSIVPPSKGVNYLTGMLDLDPGPHDIFAYPVIFFTGFSGQTPIFSLLPQDPVIIDFTPNGEVPFKATYNSDTKDSMDTKVKVALASASVRGMMIAMLMLNTKGVQKVHVDTGKLNKARVKHGKPRINPYSVLKIGTIYDRHGNAHTYTGRHMPVHWRAGHVRNQPWGPGRKQTRLIYIEPCLVNYKPETGIAPPVPRHEVTL